MRVDDHANARLVLLGNRPEGEVLERLLDGDPLELYPSTVRWMRAEGVLLDPSRLFLHAAASVAASRPPDRDVGLEDWLADRIEGAAHGLLEDDEAEFMSERTRSEDDGHAYLEDVFALEPDSTLRASVHFNALHRRARRAFIALIIEDRKIAECIEAGLGTLESLRDDARAGLAALTGREPTWRTGSVPTESATLGERS